LLLGCSRNVRVDKTHNKIDTKDEAHSFRFYVA
jgi:hypothetical protein